MPVREDTWHRVEIENLREITQKMELGERENLERMEQSWINGKGERIGIR